MSANVTALIRRTNTHLSSNAVRKAFLDFFCNQNDHTFIRSSPLVPHNDPSLAFTNAGMNQFKGVLLGTDERPAPRVANSQKCIRVGGKHNDLSIVGRDGTHHTFFEMLGNWSFGDYFKEQSCLFAWELLTGVYGLDPNRLHVTYFGGDPKLGIEPDAETKNIWRRIGISTEQLKPGSTKDNFWEMGETGPCGGCTEIHWEIDGELLELWNLVFVEYNRKQDKSLEKLNGFHVDTGMGFERLVAVLQGKSSNYDTDLFSPLFDVMHKQSKRPPYRGQYGSEDSNGLDTAYRILADHSRMITTCLSDGFLPDQEGKLRGIIRKALTIARDNFGDERTLLTDLSSVVAGVLDVAYPEISMRLNRVHHIIEHESELLRTLREDGQIEWKKMCESNPAVSNLNIDECPSLLRGYKWLQETITPISPGSHLQPGIAWKMCESFGIPPYLAEQVANASGMNLDTDALEMEMYKSKIQSKSEITSNDTKNNLPPEIVQNLEEERIEHTYDYFKYAYRYEFEKSDSFKPQPASILALIVNEQLVNYVPPEIFTYGIDVGVILDRTNMYSEAGGQISDKGILTMEDGMLLDVIEVTQSKGYIVHWVKCSNPNKNGLSLHNIGVIQIDNQLRLGAMRNHTATHLLSTALKAVLKIADQKSTRVKSNMLSFDFSVYRETLSVKDIERIQNLVLSIIRQGIPVKRKFVKFGELSSVDNLTTIPGETYLHRVVRLIEIDSGFTLSREPCCGTHVNYTSDLEDFVIVNYKSLSTSVKNIHAVTGPQAYEARKNSTEFWGLYEKVFEETMAVTKRNDHNKKEVEECAMKVASLLKSIKETLLMDYVSQIRLTEKINELKTILKYASRGSLRSSMESELEDVLENNSKSYFVHFLQCSSSLDSVPLSKASKMCPHKPSLIFARSEGLVKARCNVPPTIDNTLYLWSADSTVRLNAVNVTERAQSCVLHNLHIILPQFYDQAFLSSKFSAQLWLGHVCNQLEAKGSPPKGQNPDLVFNMKGKILTDEKLKIGVDAAIDFVEHAL